MTSPLRVLLILVVALLVGAGFGWLVTGRPVVTDEVPPPVVLASPSRRSRVQWTKAEFVTAGSQFSTALMSGAYNPYTSILAEWTDDEVRAALEESLGTPECVMTGGGHEGLPGMLLRAWMDRDLDAAAAWLEALESPAGRYELFLTLSHHWPEDRSGEGLEFFLRFKQKMPGASGWSIITKAIRQQAAVSPQAVGVLLGRLLDEKVDLAFGNPLVFPAGFDFPALAAQEVFGRLPEAGLGQSLVSEWVRRDHDGVFDWVVREGKWKQATGLLAGPVGGGPENLTWLAERIEGLDDSRREAVLENVEFASVQPAMLVQLADAFKDPEISERVKCEGLRSIFRGDVRRMLPLLESISSPERRLEILAVLEAPQHGGNYPGFDVTDEAILSGKLREWGANESQVSAIVEHVRKPTTSNPP